MVLQRFHGADLAITNLAALPLQPSERLFPRWLTGPGLIVIGLVWQMISHQLQATP